MTNKNLLQRIGQFGGALAVTGILASCTSYTPKPLTYTLGVSKPCETSIRKLIKEEPKTIEGFHKIRVSSEYCNNITFMIDVFKEAFKLSANSELELKEKRESKKDERIEIKIDLGKYGIQSKQDYLNFHDKKKLERQNRLPRIEIIPTPYFGHPPIGPSL